MPIVSLTVSISNIIVDPAQEALDRLKRAQDSVLRACESSALITQYRSDLLGPDPAPAPQITIKSAFPEPDVVRRAKRKIGFGERY